MSEPEGKEPSLVYPIQSIILPSTDIERHVAFYCEGLDFDRIDGLTLQEHGIVAVARGATEIAFGPVDERAEGPGAVICLHVPSVQPWYERAQEKELPIIEDLTDQPWGVRSFIVEDPEGFRVLVAEKLRRGDPEKA